MTVIPIHPARLPDFQPLEPPSGRGRLWVRPALDSPGFGPRDLFVWQADGAGADGPCPVLYLQDGQNLFEAGRVPFGVAWEIDRCASDLIDAGRIPPLLVVGIASTGNRLIDYAPDAILSRLAPDSRHRIETAYGGLPGPNGYAAFVVGTVKPLIDRLFPTAPDPASTFIVGSSMGGVAAVDIWARYPGVFGGIAALSGHFSLLPVGDLPPPPETFVRDVAAAVRAFALERLPPAGRHRFWLDRSERDLDQYYGPAHEALVSALNQLGYTSGQDMISRSYAGVGHNEAAWRDRLQDVLPFLLGPRP
ncbi:alpha/beta hydrolase [Brevundimonas sp. R86498]|uniref:alpha/beta hydrolase n=1 Tax=Brevundimonas sp. R86498 TaxID=3093845 RepID=UPI0037C4FDA7